MEQLSAFPVEIRLAPDLLADRLPAGRRPAGPVLLRARPISGLGAAVKVAEDYAMAILALAIAAVPMLLIAIAIKLDSPGPVFFRQRRTGFNDRPFDVLKFRTMYAEATDHEVLRQVRAGDARITPVGAILRKTSLDELPQIFNILKGDMSFVGPRPHAPGTRAAGRRLDEVVANYAARHQVKPGLTGLAQVRGWRGPTITEEQIIRRVESDLEYIERWSPWLDITIILRTLLAVACMRNAL
ncbi:MAG: sugar transferase [Roseomonas sp.]|nr:sugar transferase [Roseomonas sp.]